MTIFNAVIAKPLSFVVIEVEVGLTSSGAENAEARSEVRQIDTRNGASAKVLMMLLGSELRREVDLQVLLALD